MKKYVLIAGVNGAGKSTLYQTISSLKEMNRINTDEILRELGDWRNSNDLFKVGRYVESFKRLVEILPLCDITILYDNVV